MSGKSYVIYGAGGHAKVIIDLILTLNGKVECVFDDQPEALNFELLGIQVMRYSPDVFPEAEMIIAIGNNEVRKLLAEQIKHAYATLVHPTAFVSNFVKLGGGTVVLANAIVQVDTKIGHHVIINAGACIDHEVQIADFAHIASLVYIGGAAIIEEAANIRPGALIRRLVTVPAHAFIKPNTIVK